MYYLSEEMQDIIHDMHVCMYLDESKVEDVIATTLRSIKNTHHEDDFEYITTSILVDIVNYIEEEVEIDFWNEEDEWLEDVDDIQAGLDKLKEEGFILENVDTEDIALASKKQYLIFQVESEQNIDKLSEQFIKE
jgi:hypothetical protein